jgi:hypothetical protein
MVHHALGKIRSGGPGSLTEESNTRDRHKYSERDYGQIAGLHS